MKWKRSWNDVIEKEDQKEGQINCDKKRLWKDVLMEIILWNSSQFASIQFTSHVLIIGTFDFLSQFKCPIDRLLKNHFLPCIDCFKPDFISPSERMDEKTMDQLRIQFLDSKKISLDPSKKTVRNEKLFWKKNILIIL